MTFHREQLVEQLKELGIGDGEVVFFHSSLKTIGRVEPGPEAVIQAFLDAVGPEGTVAVPTIIPAFRGIRPLFNVKESPSEMGLLTEVVRKWPGAVRSSHPTHSVAAVGARAEELCKGHGGGWGPNSPWGRNAVGYGTPWDKLREWDAWILLVGVDFGNCTLLHHAQARYLDARKGITWKDPWPYFDFHKMGAFLEREGIVGKGRLGDAECRIARGGDIVEKALAILEREEEAIFRGTPVDEWLSLGRRIRKEGRLKAGAFQIPVVPEGLNQEVGRTLHMKGVILQDPRGLRAAHVVWDHGALLKEDGDPIRETIAEAAEVPFENVLLTATHTHSGYWWPFEPHPEYRDFIIKTIAAPVKEAASRLEPVRAGWRTIQAPGLRRNRSVYLKDGRAYTERWAIPSTWHVPEEDILRHGPDDDELRMLILERLDGSRLAVMANFSCHNSAALKDPRITDDFFGVAAEIVGRVEDCVVLISPGSEGDQDPTAMVELGGERNMKYAARMGRRLAGYLLVALAEVEMHDLFEVAIAGCRVDVPVKEEWKPEALKSGNPFRETRAKEGKVTVEVSALSVGDYAMVGIPAEFFTTPARRIREHSPFPITSVMSLTNGDVIYVAEKDAFFPGSQIYGTENHFPEMAAPGTDSLFVESGLGMLRRVKREILSREGSSGKGMGEEGP